VVKGGHYAPAVGYRYLEAEREGNAPPGLSLKGVGIGNGLTNPLIQYRYAGEFAFKNTYGIQAINQTQYDEMNSVLPHCEAKIAACNSGGMGNKNCLDAYIFCSIHLDKPYIDSGRSIYDIRTTDDGKGDIAMMTEFLSQRDVRGALQIEKSQNFHACNIEVAIQFVFGEFGKMYFFGGVSTFHHFHLHPCSIYMLEDFMVEYEKAIGFLLDKGIDVLIYAGDADFIW
jgi:cathepsin A (carboxypeptidase C)